MSSIFHPFTLSPSSALYEAQAKIAKAKASSYLARHPHAGSASGGGGGNFGPPPQPSNQDDNVEYNQEQVIYQ